jgi:hypothetical protein
MKPDSVVLLALLDASQTETTALTVMACDVVVLLQVIHWECVSSCWGIGAWQT